MWYFGQYYTFLCKNARPFFCCIFLQFWALLLMFVTIMARDHMEIWFYFKYAYLKEHISAFEENLSFSHWVMLPLKHWSVEKIWTFVDYISLRLIGHVTIWVRFVSTKGGILEYLLSTMWSFWHQWIFQLEKARKLHFLWFWGMTSSSANEITCFFSIFLLHFHN